MSALCAALPPRVLVTLLVTLATLFRAMLKQCDFPLCVILPVMVWGRFFTALPTVLHYGNPGTGLTLEPGMIFTIEPMINAGKADTKILGDGWTAVTRDKSLSAQFEHSIGITEGGDLTAGYKQPRSCLR